MAHALRLIGTTELAIEGSRGFGGDISCSAATTAGQARQRAHLPESHVNNAVSHGVTGRSARAIASSTNSPRTRAEHRLREASPGYNATNITTAPISPLRCTGAQLTGVGNVANSRGFYRPCMSHLPTTTGEVGGCNRKPRVKRHGAFHGNLNGRQPYRCVCQEPVPYNHNLRVEGTAFSATHGRLIKSLSGDGFRFSNDPEWVRRAAHAVTSAIGRGP